MPSSCCSHRPKCLGRGLFSSAFLSLIGSGGETQLPLARCSLVFIQAQDPQKPLGTTSWCSFGVPSGAELGGNSAVVH